MRGRLTGCCPGDLVKQVYLRSNLPLYFLLYWVVFDSVLLFPSFSCLWTKFFQSDIARLNVVPYCDSYLTCRTVLASLVLQMVLLGYHAMFLNLAISLRDRIAMLKLALVALHRETTIYKKVQMYRIIHQGLSKQKPLQWPMLFKVKYQITVEECLFTPLRLFLYQWCKQRVLDHL